VDDDAALRHLLNLALQRQGFRVWLAASGAEAVALFQRERGGIDLALLDVCMPERDGPQTLADLRRLDPDLPCCFMSGHTAQYSHDDLLNLGAARFFDKPFRLDEVTDALATVARARRGR
jgi:DNA-binding response OmpR family regulator